MGGADSLIVKMQFHPKPLGREAEPFIHADWIFKNLAILQTQQSHYLVCFIARLR
jgi:hypothetical protein